MSDSPAARLPVKLHRRVCLVLTEDAVLAEELLARKKLAQDVAGRLSDRGLLVRAGRGGGCGGGRGGWKEAGAGRGRPAERPGAAGAAGPGGGGGRGAAADGPHAAGRR